MPPEENKAAPKVETAPNQAESSQTMTAQEYVEAVRKMKETMVPKEKYDKVMSENKILTAAVIDGKDLPEGFAKAGSQGSRTASDLRKALFSGKEMTNLEYVSTALDLRDKVIEEEGPEADPFAGGQRRLGVSRPTRQDYEAAEEVAKTLRECVDNADGDPAAFNAYLSSVIVETPGSRSRLLQKK